MGVKISHLSNNKNNGREMDSYYGEGISSLFHKISHYVLSFNFHVEIYRLDL